MLPSILNGIGVLKNTVVLAKDILDGFNKTDDEVLEHNIVGLGETANMLLSIDTDGLSEADRKVFFDSIDNIKSINQFVAKFEKIIK